MSFSKGITRLGKVSKIIGWLLAALVWGVAILAVQEGSGSPLFLSILGAVLLGIFWTVGWILEGFGNE